MGKFAVVINLVDSSKTKKGEEFGSMLPMFLRMYRKIKVAK